MWYKSLVSLVMAAVAVVAPGCVHNTEFPEPLKPALVMHADKSLTATERKYLEESADIWRKQTSGLADIRFVYDFDPEDPLSVEEHQGDHTVTRLTSMDFEVVAYDCELAEAKGLPEEAGCPPSVLAWVGPSGGIHNSSKIPVNYVVIPDRYESRERFVSVSIHELGHVFGMPHSNFRQAVMWPSNDPSKTCLKQPDLAAFCSANDCTGYKMHPCE